MASEHVPKLMEVMDIRRETITSYPTMDWVPISQSCVLEDKIDGSSQPKRDLPRNIMWAGVFEEASSHVQRKSLSSER